MLMCYLKVCPFTKPIGQDCTVEKREDQCCPIITCPEGKYLFAIIWRIKENIYIKKRNRRNKYNKEIELYLRIETYRKSTKTHRH